MGNPNVPIGYRFSPSVEQSLKVYLKRKILNQELPVDVIPNVDVYSCGNPRQIPFGEFKHGPDNEWQFFTNKRNENPIQTTSGRWEEIGDEEIQDGDDGSIGFMRELVFKYSHPEDKEEEKEWYIHEYRATPANFTADELVGDDVQEKISNLVLCKVFCKEEIPPSKPPTNSFSDEEDDNEVVDGANP
ncbi:hypothetical protein RHGRI_003977 [Rhododendron griersonianum]|uniref:NAC domain-containing protein n=1 Tax=Rhododendron griersonianum TaxID=479676 RepID=A0AAV6L8Q5_9ERIC|nr:hypothetical protein RHGRI_003977 [Rhododendron griersonianum]